MASKFIFGRLACDWRDHSRHADPALVSLFVNVFLCRNPLLKGLEHALWIHQVVRSALRHHNIMIYTWYIEGLYHSIQGDVGK